MAASTKSKVSARELAEHFVSFQRSAVPLVPEGADVKKAELTPLKSNEIPTYRQVKSTFKTDLKGRDLRFRLSDQVASQLSVEQEEEERFKKRVQEELEAQLAIVKTEAHNAGFAQGQAEGKAQAFEEEKVRIAKMLESLAVLVKNLSEAKEKLAEDYE